MIATVVKFLTDPGVNMKRQAIEERMELTAVSHVVVNTFNLSKLGCNRRCRVAGQWSRCQMLKMSRDSHQLIVIFGEDTGLGVE
jgi:hypothetical protein